MSKFKAILCFCCAFFLLVGCSDDAPVVEEPVETPTAEVTEIIATEEPTIEPTATTEPTATPIPLSFIDAKKQYLNEEEQFLLVDELYLSEDGWVVATADDLVLGAVSLASGEHTAIQIPVDPVAVPDKVILSLYAYDEDEFVLDEAVSIEADSKPVRRTLTTQVSVPLPYITVNDQPISRESNQVLIDSFLVFEDGWVVVTNEFDAILGSLFVEAGEARGVTIPVRWQDGTSTLSVALYEDSGSKGKFEPEKEIAVLLHNEPVIESFSALYPPSALVFDQPLVGNRIVIDKVYADAPLWVAVSETSLDGTIGSVIGKTLVDSGVHSNVPVDIVPAGITNNLFIRLYQDVGTAGTFEYPQSDPVIERDGAILWYQIGTGSADLLVTKDQLITEQVIVDTAVVSAPRWVVVYADAGGELGEMLGREYIGAGVNENITVEIKGKVVYPVHVVLHADEGESESFDEAEDRILYGEDEPIQSFIFNP